MKRLLPILLTLALLGTLCACADSKTPVATDGQPVPTEIPTADTLPFVLNSNEYELYFNIFYNQTGGDYVGQTQTKTGVFTRLFDSFNKRTRYYVWGYMDQTKCCDWQWEFVPEDPNSLPPDGSLVEMTGTFNASDEALDGYWFTDASVTLKTRYRGPACDLPMTVMDGTLERVQLINVQYYSQEYEGQTVRLYGRVYDANHIQHPYYDGAWTQEVAADGGLPAIGTLVVVSGTVRNGVVVQAAVEPTTEY